MRTTSTLYLPATMLATVQAAYRGRIMRSCFCTVLDGTTGKPVDGYAVTVLDI